MPAQLLSLCSSPEYFPAPLQFEALAGFSAIIDRLGEFTEVVDSYVAPSRSNNGARLEAPIIELVDAPVSTAASRSERLLLSLEDVTLQTPNGAMTLIDSLSLQVCSAAIAFLQVLRTGCGDFPDTCSICMHILTCMGRI